MFEISPQTLEQARDRFAHVVLGTLLSRKARCKDKFPRECALYFRCWLSDYCARKVERCS